MLVVLEEKSINSIGGSGKKRSNIASSSPGEVCSCTRGAFDLRGAWCVEVGPDFDCGSGRRCWHWLRVRLIVDEVVGDITDGGRGCGRSGIGWRSVAQHGRTMVCVTCCVNSWLWFWLRLRSGTRLAKCGQSLLGPLDFWCGMVSWGWHWPWLRLWLWPQ